jgi:hypothetical protein
MDTSTEMIVCPINVPDQTPYIPMREISIAPVAIHEKRCAWFPACKMKQNVCGGSRRDRCQYYKHKKDDKEFVKINQAEKKLLYDAERKKLIMRELRKKRRRK